MALVFFRAKHLRQVACKAARRFQDAPFAGGPKIGYSSFKEMAGTVQFMPLLQVCKAVRWFPQSIIGVQITIRTLRFGDQVTNLIRFLFQRWVSCDFDRIGGGLQPFVQITILKGHAIVCTAAKPGGNSEILDAVAWRGTCHTVMQHLPLIREHSIVYQTLHTADQPIRKTDGSQGNRLLMLHAVRPPCVFISVPVCHQSMPDRFGIGSIATI